MDEQMELQLDWRGGFAERPYTRKCHGFHGYDSYDRYCFFCGYDRGAKRYRKLIAELELNGTPGCIELAAKLRQEGGK